MTGRARESGAGLGSARQLGRDLWLLDTRFRGEPGVIASYLLTGQRGLALIDTGPASTIEQLLAEVAAAGFDPGEIEHLIVTHVHLDHAGAAGRLLQLLPRARVYVHRRGAPHLIDPSRLIASAARIYGEHMDAMWGPILPVPRERLVVVDEGDELAVGDRRLRALYTPGHAVHHIALYGAEAGEVFAGDVAGVRLQDVAFVRPPTPPPDLNLEDWTASIERIEQLDPRRLYLAHYGPVHDARSHLAELRGRLASWGEITLAGLRAGRDEAQIAAELEAASRDVLRRAALSGHEDEAERRNEIASNYLMSAQGYMRYWRKYHPELLAGSSGSVRS